MPPAAGSFGGERVGGGLGADGARAAGSPEGDGEVVAHGQLVGGGGVVLACGLFGEWAVETGEVVEREDVKGEWWEERTRPGVGAAKHENKQDDQSLRQKKKVASRAVPCRVALRLRASASRRTITVRRTSILSPCYRGSCLLTSYSGVARRSSWEMPRAVAYGPVIKRGSSLAGALQGLASQSIQAAAPAARRGGAQNGVQQSNLLPLQLASYRDKELSVNTITTANRPPLALNLLGS